MLWQPALAVQRKRFGNTFYLSNFGVMTACTGGSEETIRKLMDFKAVVFEVNQRCYDSPARKCHLTPRATTTYGVFWNIVTKNFFPVHHQQFSILILYWVSTSFTLFSGMNSMERSDLGLIWFKIILGLIFFTLENTFKWLASFD